MLISGLNKTTLLDYPGRVAATVFTGGCNFRCPFCHNGGLVLSPLTQEHYTEEDILDFLKKTQKYSVRRLHHRWRTDHSAGSSGFYSAN